jgi:diadenosine tetraphosphate (Ap4A) HIT family hydrolase
MYKLKKEDKTMKGCFYCEKNDDLYSRMLKIIDLPCSTVYLNRNQTLKGRCIVTFKEHKTEYFQLSDAERDGYFKDVARTAEALWNLYKPDKLNYATFGDGVPHVHVHIVPTYKGQPFWGGPFADEPVKKLSDAEYQAMIAEIKAEIERLAAGK